MRISDWSSDVCSSVLREGGIAREELHLEGRVREFAPVAHVEIALQAVGEDRKSVVSGTSVSVRVDLGGRGIITKKKQVKNYSSARIITPTAIHTLYYLHQNPHTALRYLNTLHT